jgi:hypothetical protein
LIDELVTCLKRASPADWENTDGSLTETVWYNRFVGLTDRAGEAVGAKTRAAPHGVDDVWHRIQEWLPTTRGGSARGAAALAAPSWIESLCDPVELQRRDAPDGPRTAAGSVPSPAAGAPGTSSRCHAF